MSHRVEVTKDTINVTVENVQVFAANNPEDSPRELADKFAGAFRERGVTLDSHQVRQIRALISKGRYDLSIAPPPVEPKPQPPKPPKPPIAPPTTPPAPIGTVIAKPGPPIKAPQKTGPKK